MNKKIVLIMLLVLIAFMLRFSDETCFYAWDEAVYLQHAEIIGGFKDNNFNEFYFRPVILPILIAGTYKMYHDPIMARLLITVLGAASIFLAYRLGTMVFNKKVGIIAAALLAFWPFHVYFSKTILTHIPALFFALLFLYFLKLGEEKDSSLFFAAAGAFAALTILTRFTYIILVPLFLIYLWLYRKQYTWKKIALLAASFLAVMTPYLIWNHLTYQNPFYSFIWARVTISWSPADPWYFYLQTIKYFLGPFGIIGLVGWAFRKKTEKMTYFELFLVSWLIIFFISIHTVLHKEIRFLFPMLLPILFLSALGFETIIKNIKKNKFLCIIAAALLVFLFFNTNIGGFYVDCNSTTKQVGLWINENAPEDSVIYAQEDYPIIAYYSKQHLEIAPYFKDKFFNDTHKYMNQSGYYVFFDNQINDPRFPQPDELESDPRFELIKQFEGENKAYIYSYEYIPSFR